MKSLTKTPKLNVEVRLYSVDLLVEDIFLSASWKQHTNINLDENNQEFRALRAGTNIPLVPAHPKYYRE